MGVAPRNLYPLIFIDMAYNNQDPAGKALSSMKKDYAIIGKRHIRAWHLWLIVGVLAGAVGAVALVARNSAEGPLALKFGKSRAALEEVLPLPPISNGIRVLSPNGGEVLVKGEGVMFVWSAPNESAVNIELVPNKSIDGSGEIFLVGNNIQNTGQFFWVVPSHIVSRKYNVRIWAHTEDKSDSYFGVVDATSAPAISGARAIYNTIRPGDTLGISLLGVNFGDKPGVLDILDSTGNVAARFNESKPDFWDFVWSYNSIVLNIYPSVTAGFAPGVYNMAARVLSAPFGGGRGKQVYSNIVPFSFTVLK